MPEAVSMVSTNSSASGSSPSPANVPSPQPPEVAPSIPETPSVEPTSPKRNGTGKDKWYKRKGTKGKEKEKEKSSAQLLKAPLLDKRLSTAPGKQPEALAPPSPASTVGSLSLRSSSPSHPQSDVEGKGEGGPALQPSLTRKSSSASRSRPSAASSASTPNFADDVPAVPPLPPLSESPTVQFYRTPRPLSQPRPSFEVSQRATGTAGRESGELNGHAKFNGDLNRRSKSRPNSLHGDMLATASSSSSDLLTPTTGAPPDTTLPPSADSSSSGMATASQTMVSSPLSTVTTAGDQGAVGAGSNWRKATKKLSLTGTMLGFSKKEKHRDKLGTIS